MQRVLTERVLPTGQTLQIVEGDITAETTDAIVHAANAYLQHGGGVAGAIVEEGGQIIHRESNEWLKAHGLVMRERPAWNSAGRLRAKYIDHAVGPQWGDSDKNSKLASAVRGSLQVADELHCRPSSLPATSTGIFDFPLQRAARVIISSLRRCFADTQSGIRLVRIVRYDLGTSFEFIQVWEDTQWETGIGHQKLSERN